MRSFAVGLLVVLPLAAFDTQVRFADQLRSEHLHGAVIESGRIIWQYGKIAARAPEEPVIAERLERLAARGRVSLDDPAPLPPGATIRQVLSNTADGTPGEETLDNPGFFDALKPIAGGTPLPNALEFALQDHGTLGWFSQEYAGERLLWAYGPRVLVVRVPGKKRTLVVSANSPAVVDAARLEDGNILRSKIALAFFKDFVGLTVRRDELVDDALVAHNAAPLRQALDKFPELESRPDVTLLYLFSQLGLPETEASATAVIKAHPSLPTAWFYYGQYLENSKRYREAAACFEKITMHQPPWHNWTVAAARKELRTLKTN